MKISGTLIADKILEELKKEIYDTKITPHLVIIFASNDPNSETYIRHKQAAAEKIGIMATVYRLNQYEEADYFPLLENLQTDTTIHGIITQLPIYESWDSQKCISAIDPKRDVDGFNPESPFFGATALGVWEMLGAFAHQENYDTTEEFLRNKSIVVLGRGRTAGGPTMKLLTAHGFDPININSKTPNPDQLLKNADVIISATGKKHIVTADKIKKDSYVIGIGVGKEIVDGKAVTFGDIDPDIESKAKLYCPTIGGIGPLTIACLLRNVVIACKNQK